MFCEECYVEKTELFVKVEGKFLCKICQERQPLDTSSKCEVSDKRVSPIPNNSSLTSTVALPMNPSRNPNCFVLFARMICEECCVEKTELFVKVNNKFICKCCRDGHQQNTQSHVHHPAECLSKELPVAQLSRSFSDVVKRDEEPTQLETSTRRFEKSGPLIDTDDNFEEINLVENKTEKTSNCSETLVAVDTSPAYSTTPICYDDSTTEPSLEDEPVVENYSSAEEFVTGSNSCIGIDTMDTDSRVKLSSNRTTAVEKSRSPELSCSPETSTVPSILSRKSCHNCGKPRVWGGRIHPETGVPLCPSCHRYFKIHGIDKPSSLFTSCSTRSVRNPREQKRIIVECSHCKSSSLQFQNYLHPVTRNILCRVCSHYYRTYGKDRPTYLIIPKQERQYCSRCGILYLFKRCQRHPRTKQLLCRSCHAYYYNHRTDRPAEHIQKEKFVPCSYCGQKVLRSLYPPETREFSCEDCKTVHEDKSL